MNITCLEYLNILNISALSTMAQETTPEVERPKTLTQFNIFNQVFVNSSSLDAATLWTANELLSSTIDRCTIPPTPVRQYVRKLSSEAKQLQAQSIVHQHDVNNLRSIINKRMTCTKGKMIALKDHFHTSTQELCDAVVESEKATKRQAGKKCKNSEW